MRVMTKYIFVTGGVCSGLGKGITASSIALLLKAKGYKVFMQKFDPYINVDPGTMNPIEHGEVFVTADGSETDLDLGHYERFIDEELNYTSNVTNGKIYSTVIEKERKGDYLGKNVQMIPDISNEVKRRIYEAGEISNADFVITEIGGTVGDIESAIMLESLRQVKMEQPKNTLFVHTTLVPYLFGSNELKTKPTQNSIISLRKVGLHPDIIVTRSSINLTENTKSKISLFGNIPKENIIEAVDVNNIYKVPINFNKQNIEEIILNHFDMENKKSNLTKWKNLIKTVDNLEEEIEISLVGKYIALEDAYLSVKESLKHAGYSHNVKVNINWVDSEVLEKPSTQLNEVFKNSKGILIPGGFGTRGIEGKIKACEYARVNNIPYFGICLGMQIAVIEFARNVCGIKDATSKEFNDKSVNKIIDLMENQKNISNLGGTLRLGNYDCKIKENTKTYKAYKQKNIKERHRHRYEFNNDYKELMEEKGLLFTGINEQANLVEIIELPSHKHFIACQFHPEFKSRPTTPHPLFLSFISSAIEK